MIVSHRLDPQNFTSRFGLVQFGVTQKSQQIILKTACHCHNN